MFSCASRSVFTALQVEPDPFFERDGADIHVTMPVPLSSVLLGGTVTVPTVRGEVDLKIPPGTQVHTIVHTYLHQ